MGSWSNIGGTKLHFEFERSRPNSWAIMVITKLKIEWEVSKMGDLNSIFRVSVPD